MSDQPIMTIEGNKKIYIFGQRSVIVPADWEPDPVMHPSGRIFESSRGGPYKYGYALKATPTNMRLAAFGIL